MLKRQAKECKQTGKGQTGYKEAVKAIKGARKTGTRQQKLQARGHKKTGKGVKKTGRRK